MATNNVDNEPTATSGQVWTANGIGTVSSFQTLTSGNLIKLSNQVLSGANDCHFDSTVITATYKTYLLVIQNWLTDASGASQNILQVSVDNGANMKATGYQAGLWYTAYNSTTIGNYNTTTSFYLTAITSNATQGQNGYYWIFLNTGNNPMQLQGCIFGNNTYWMQAAGVWAPGSSNTVNYIKISQSGRTYSGTFTLYGLVQ